MQITCYHCFAQVPARRLHFKCFLHAPAPPHVFPWKPGWFASCPTRSALCPAPGCDLRTGYRVCPVCRYDLPYFIGRTPQQIIAVTGCSATGKTVYLWSLLHELQGRIAREEDPFAVAMFENDESYRFYRLLSRSLVERRELPELTHSEEMRRGDMKPVIVRLLQPASTARHRNLIFYDPSGELIENLEDVRYLRYLSHSAAILYLVESPCGDEDVDGALSTIAADGLGAIVHELRSQLNLASKQLLPIALGLILTKGDDHLFPHAGGVERLVVNASRRPGFWRGRVDGEVSRTSQECEAVLRRFGYDAVVNLARLNFRTVRLFAVSSLGAAPVEGLVPAPIRPVGVENPLFWALGAAGRAGGGRS